MTTIGLRVAFFFAIACFASCKTPVIDPGEASELVGSCQQLSQPGYLIKHGKYLKGGFAGKYLIVTEEFYYINKDSLVGSLAKGTQLKVRRVLKDVNFTASCWRIEVEILSGQLAGNVSELPACYTSHPPTWLNADGPRNPVVEKLEIKPEYAVPCAGKGLVE